jgi:hypothetical protein
VSHGVRGAPLRSSTAAAHSPETWGDLESTHTCTDGDQAGDCAASIGPVTVDEPV